MRWRDSKCLYVLGPLAFIVLVAVNCKELLSESSLAPINDCSAHACRALSPGGTCEEQGRYCHVNSAFDFTVVISTSAGSPPYKVPMTVAMTSDQLKEPADQPCEPQENCVYVPTSGGRYGWYSLQPAASESLGLKLGNPGLYTSIPTHTVWVPSLLFDPPGDAGPQWVPVTDFGYPLEPIFAPIVKPLEVPADRDGGPPPPDPGPFGTVALTYNVSMPKGQYLRIVAPDPPFDTSVPPREDVIDVPGGFVPDPFRLSELDSNEARSFNIFPDETSPRDLTGFTAVLQDIDRHRNISRVAVLHAGTNEVTLHTTGHPNLTNVRVELIVSPPPGTVGVPSLVSQALPVMGKLQKYPVVQPPVTFSGTVTGPEGGGPPIPVESTLVFRSVEGAIPSNANVLLRYETRVRTDASGKFETKLPLGRYDVAIFPEDRSEPGQLRPAQWIGQLDVTGAFQKTFALAWQTEVTGTVVLGDGTVVPEAEVEAHAAAEPGEPLDDKGPPFKYPPFAQTMRTGATITDALGRFSLRLDPGYYDIVVRPKDGTRFPWVVSTSHQIANTSVTLAPLVVPAPIDVSGTLFTPPNASGESTLPVREAMVRVFAVPRAKVGQAKRRAVEIGRTMIGSDGKMQLFLAGPPN